VPVPEHALARPLPALAQVGPIVCEQCCGGGHEFLLPRKIPSML